MPRIAYLGVLVASSLLAGCGIEGKWALRDVDPTAARRDVPYQSFTFQDDGTYYAEALEADGRVGSQSGVYTYKDGALTLRPHEAAARTFPADLAGDELKIRQPWRDREVKATFERKPE